VSSTCEVAGKHCEVKAERWAASFNAKKEIQKTQNPEPLTSDGSRAMTVSIRAQTPPSAFNVRSTSKHPAKPETLNTGVVPLGCFRSDLPSLPLKVELYLPIQFQTIP
jgi:hypothetical protein